MNRSTTNIAHTDHARIETALSAIRLQSYAAHDALTDTVRSLARCVWDAKVAAAFLWPLQICEVCLRSAIAQAIALSFGRDWINSATFIRALPQEMDDALKNAKSKAAGSVDKTITELSFGFWRGMLTKRFDNHIWSHHLWTVFPNLLTTLQTAVARENLYRHVSQAKKLRDRIAHHKPILMRYLSHDFENISRVIGWRCRSTQAWMTETETVSLNLGVELP